MANNRHFINILEVIRDRNETILKILRDSATQASGSPGNDQ